MNAYHKNEIASLEGFDAAQASDHVLDTMLELAADINGNYITISGSLKGISAIDSFCIANTNALSWRLEIRDEVWEGYIESYITIHDFGKTVFADSFTLDLSGLEPMYIGHLFLGTKTVLPRFAVGPETGTALRGESSRSFGGQAFGMRRNTLKSFSVNYPRLTNEERETILEYIEAVQNAAPHIIDPYHEARDEFPPMYVTLSSNEAAFTKRNESGFYFSGSLAWQEAR